MAEHVSSMENALSLEDRRIPVPISALVDTPIGPRRASDIAVGDRVLTNKNRFKKVEATSVGAVDGKIYEVAIEDTGAVLVLREDVELETHGGWVSARKLLPTAHKVRLTYGRKRSPVWRDDSPSFSTIQRPRRLPDDRPVLAVFFEIEEDDGISVSGVPIKISKE